MAVYPPQGTGTTLGNPNVTFPGRSAGVPYQNTSGSRIIVYVSVSFSSPESFQASIGSSSPSNIILYGSVIGLVSPMVQSITFVVPSGWYYEVDVTGSATINSWAESPL